MLKLISRLDKFSILPYLIILILGILIYIYIDGKLLFNPDFGQSDIYHGYGIRYYLSENLKTNKLPFWTDKWVGGFPFSSEWQVGSLFLPNIIAFKILSFPVAVNALIIFVFIVLTIGFYLLLLEFKTNRWLALLISLNFAFNGSLAFRLTHYSLLQSFSLCPILFYFIVKFIRTNKLIYILIIPFVVSQMIFAGFIPVIYISMIGLFLFVFSYMKIKLKYKLGKIISRLVILGLSFITAVLLSFPQILPSLTLSYLSSRSLNLDFDTVTAFPFRYNNLLNFISPFIFGNPKEGTYPIFGNDWGIFWENTPYAGPVIFLLMYISFLYLIIRKSKDLRFISANLFIIIFLLLLVLGKYSPLYFLFEIPPFNLFRTQSRFLIMVCFFLFFTSGISLNFLYIKSNNLIKGLVIILLIFNLFDLISVQKNYHLFVNSEKILDQPEFVSNINNENSYITLGLAPYWNNVFLKSGWKSDSEINKYLFYRNFLNPNANFLYSKKIYDIANGMGFKPRRNEYLKSLLSDKLNQSRDKTFPLQNTGNLMKLLGIRYVIAPWEITGMTKTETDEVKLENESIYFYDFSPSANTQNDFVYSPSSIKLITNLSDFENLVNQNNDFTQNAVIETPPFDNPINKKADYRIIISNVKEDSLDITFDIKKAGLLVFRKNYYPGWKMEIDAKLVPIEKINLVHMGTYVPQGQHTIRLSYHNDDFYKGLVIAIISYAIFIILIFTVRYFLKGLPSP